LKLVALTASNLPVHPLNRHVKTRTSHEGDRAVASHFDHPPSITSGGNRRRHMTFGRVNPQFQLSDQGIKGLGNVYYNQIEPVLIEAAVKRGEGTLGKGGTFLVTTGKFTGRSPKDKHVVKSASVIDTIWWENNAEMSEAGFDALYDDMLEHMKGKDYYVQDLIGGSDPAYSINVRMVTEMAWHGLFIRHMLRRPDREDLDDFLADFTVINCPSFQAQPEKHNCRSETVIAMNFDKKLILIGGTEYAGENKKSVFTLLNYLLPEKGVMPMHCSANHATGNPVRHWQNHPVR
jgi:phosphoenolpyruvate carboxykinase (ATP)